MSTPAGPTDRAQEDDDSNNESDGSQEPLPREAAHQDLAPFMSLPTSQPTILIVDDDSALLRLAETALRRDGFTTATARTGQEALRWLSRKSAELVLLDLGLPDMHGKAFIERLKDRGRSCPFLVMTGRGDERQAVALIKQGALDYLVKDVQFEQTLPGAIRRSLNKVEREAKLAAAEAHLRQSEQRLRLMVEHLPAGAVYVEGQSIFFNKATEAMTGFTRAEITTLQDWFQRLYGKHAPLVYSHYQRDRAAGFAQSRIVPLTRRDGQTRMVEFTGFAFEGGEVWLLHDVTKREQAERILRTEFAITRLFTQATPESEAAPQLLQAICEGLDWDLGELWIIDPKIHQLRRHAVWQVPALRASRFLALGGKLTLPCGSGLPGRVWATAQPSWVENLAADRNFARTSAAAAAGLHTAFGFPIRQRTEVSSVLVFFTRQTRSPEPSLLSAMSDLGRRIGNYIERKRAEEALRQSEKRLQAIFDHSPTILYLKDPEGHYLLVNRQFETLCAASADRIKGKKDPDLFPLESARILQANDQAVMTCGKPMKFEECLTNAKGVHHYLSVKFPLFDQTGEIYALCGISTDMTELKQLEREILRISEAEQRRIGQDLHDGLCQQLAGIEFISQALEQKLAGQNRPEAATAQQIAKLIREAITHTRDLAKGLSPVILEPEGLMSSLNMLAANVTTLFKIHCRLHCPKPVLLRDNSAATHLFRIAQEAVNNAIRHGLAKRIEIRLSAAGPRLVLAIHDDGHGLSHPSPESKGLGLHIMQSRASAIGGSLTIQRQKTRGTTIVCTVPRLHPPRPHEKGKTIQRVPSRKKNPHR